MAMVVIPDEKPKYTIMKNGVRIVHPKSYAEIAAHYEKIRANKNIQS